MQKISLFALIFVLIACSAPAPVIPTAPVTLTVQPTSIPTSIPTLTETATPMPTETATVEPAPTFEIASVAEFDPRLYNEVGTVINLVDNEYGIGQIVVEGIKMPEPNQVIKLPTDMHSQNSNPSELPGFTLDTKTVQNVKIQEMRLLKVTGEYNGYWVFVQVGGMKSDQEVSFGVMISGNFSENLVPEEFFKNHKIGDKLAVLSLIYSPKDVTREVFENFFLSEENRANIGSDNELKVRFNLLTQWRKGISTSQVDQLIRSGGLLPIDQVVVSGAK